MSRKVIFEGDQLSLFGTVRMGALLDALERATFNELGQPNPVYFDFGGLSTKGIESSRGHYDHLALSYQAEPAGSVSALVEILQGCVGKRFHGYKGGEYMMGMSTPIWVDQRGEWSSTAIVGLLVESARVTLLTEYQP